MIGVSDLARLRRDVEQLVRECGELARVKRSELVKGTKPDGSMVTDADRQVEGLLRKRLVELLPGTQVWGEEEGYSDPGPSGLWVVDPIDGTSNFAYGSPLWGISVALIDRGEILLGVVYLPDMDDLYSAHLGGGATRNGQPLPQIPPGKVTPQELVSYCDACLLKYAGKLPGKMRYAGAFVVEACFFFLQRFRGLISYKANVYDVAASVRIALELGAEVRFADGSPFVVDELPKNRRIEKPFIIFPRDSGFFLDN